MIFFYVSLITYLIYTALKYIDALLLLQKTKYNTNKYKNSLK